MVQTVRFTVDQLIEWMDEHHNTGMYCVYRIVENEVWEAYMCDTQQEVESCKWKMFNLSGDVGVLTRND